MTKIFIHHSGSVGNDPHSSSAHLTWQDIDNYHRSRWDFMSTLKVCLNCGGVFKKKKNHSVKYFKTAKFCSKKCHYSHGMSCEAKKKISEAKLKNPTRYWLGKTRDKKTLEAMKATQFKKGVLNHPDVCFKKGDVGYWLGKKRPNISGKKNYGWRGGITPKNEAIRKSLEYRVWRRGVFERDDFTCQECGVRGATLNADHIKPFAFFPELRFELSNGRTLCVDCHKKTDTWGEGAKKYATVNI